MHDEITPGNQCVKINKRNGERCKKFASPGNRYCNVHRQWEHAGRPATNPKTIIRQAQSRLAERAEQLLDEGFDPLNLQPLLTKQHLLSNELEKKIESEVVDVEGLKQLLPLLISLQSEIGKNIERFERIRASQAFTKQEHQLFISALVAFVETLREDERPRAIEFIQQLSLTASK